MAKKRSLAYFVVYFFTDNAGRSGFGNARLYRESALDNLDAIQEVEAILRQAYRRDRGVDADSLIVQNWRRLPADDK